MDDTIATLIVCANPLARRVEQYTVLNCGYNGVLVQSTFRAPCAASHSTSAPSSNVYASALTRSPRSLAVLSSLISKFSAKEASKPTRSTSPMALLAFFLSPTFALSASDYLLLSIGVSRPGFVGVVRVRRRRWKRRSCQRAVSVDCLLRDGVQRLGLSRRELLAGFSALENT